MSRKIKLRYRVVPTPAKSTKKRIYGAFPSKPGDPPHKQHGRLRASITYDVIDDASGHVVGRVGTNLDYGRYLELGTRNMKPHPWLRRSLMECRGEIRAILQRPMKLPK